MTAIADVDASARRLAREGYGWEDLMKRLHISEYHARSVVFGKLHAVRWWRRRRAAS
jgi:hypothetical protein